MNDLKYYQHTLLFWFLILLVLCLGLRIVHTETKAVSQSSAVWIVTP